MLPDIHRATQKFYIFLIVYLTGCTPFPGSFVILLSFEAGFMSVSFLSIRLKRITQTPLQTTFYSTQGAEAIPQYRPLLLIWNFDSNLCTASLFRIA